MHRTLLFSLAILTTAVHPERSPEWPSTPVTRGAVPLSGNEAEPKMSQSKGISLEQLLAFTKGLLAVDVVETSFKLADKNGDGLLDHDEAQRASMIGNSVAQYRVQEQLTEAEKSEDGLIELSDAKLLAQRIYTDVADDEFTAAADRDVLFTPNDVENVLSAKSSRTPLHAIFARFDEDSDGHWSREEMGKFVSVMRLDRARGWKAVEASSSSNGQLTEPKVFQSLVVFQ